MNSLILPIMVLTSSQNSLKLLKLLDNKLSWLNFAYNSKTTQKPPSYLAKKHSVSIFKQRPCYSFPSFPLHRSHRPMFSSSLSEQRGVPQELTLRRDIHGLHRRRSGDTWVARLLWEYPCLVFVWETQTENRSHIDFGGPLNKNKLCLNIGDPKI